MIWSNQSRNRVGMLACRLGRSAHQTIIRPKLEVLRLARTHLQGQVNPSLELLFLRGAFIQPDTLYRKRNKILRDAYLVEPKSLRGAKQPAHKVQV